MKLKFKTKKKTRQGNGKYTKNISKGSQAGKGGKTPKGYKKKYKGQGKR